MSPHASHVDLKVKKFRIKPRLGIVARLLKSSMSMKALPPEVEELLPKESESFLTHIRPLAFYSTWSGEAVPPFVNDFFKAQGLKKPVSVSALVATIGSSVEEYLSSLLLKGETTKAAIVAALSEDTADAAFQFIFKILNDEAKNEECEVGDPLPLNDPSFLIETLNCMEAGRESVSADQAGHLTPRFTRIGLAPWWPMNKRKGISSLTKKK